MSSTPASEAGWLPTTPTEWPSSRAKPHTMFVREVLVHLEELAVVDDETDHVAHVVRLVRRVRHDRVELRVHAVRVVGRVHVRRRLEVVRRQEGEEVARVLEAGVLVLGREVGDARLRVVRHRAAELLERRPPRRSPS